MTTSFHLERSEGFLKVWTWYTGEGIVGREIVDQKPQRWEIKGGGRVCSRLGDGVGRVTEYQTREGPK